MGGRFTCNIGGGTANEYMRYAFPVQIPMLLGTDDEDGKNNLQEYTC